MEIKYIKDFLLNEFPNQNNTTKKNMNVKIKKQKGLWEIQESF